MQIDVQNHVDLFGNSHCIFRISGRRIFGLSNTSEVRVSSPHIYVTPFSAKRSHWNFISGDQRNLLYPCLSNIGTSKSSSLPVILEGDAIRLAGGCILSIAISSLGLLVPLLPPCCKYHEADRDCNFLLRTLLFMQGMKNSEIYQCKAFHLFF